MLSHDIPERPWSLINQGILMWEGKWHLRTKCYYSDWIVIDILPNTLTSTVVELTKAHFARFGVPDRVVTDNGHRVQAICFGVWVQTRDLLPILAASKWKGRSCS